MKTVSIRYLLATLFGVFLLGLCLNLTYNSREMQMMFHRHTLRSRFAGLEKSINFFRAEHGRLPRKLIELENLPESYFKPSRDWSIKDIWGNPILYELHGRNYLLISLGADNKVGGVGIDCDVTNKNLNPEDSKPTFMQVMRDRASIGMVVASVVCAILGSFLALVAINEQDLKSKNVLALLIKSAITFIGVSYVALFVTMMHYPSGH